MKKIMFNAKYGLTAAVLNGNKTMTRRIIPLTDADMDYLDNAFDWDLRESVIIDRYAKYKVGEIVAIAQAYKEVFPNADFEMVGDEFMTESKGWNNKMFVAAYYMPHHIRITDIKVERLQEISKEDCLREGIDEDSAEGSLLYWWSVPHEGISWEAYKKRCYELSRHEYKGKPGSYYWETPQDAFACLIDKVSGKGTWDSNPWVFAYSFEKID